MESINHDNSVSSLHPDYIDSISLWDYLDDLYYGSDRWLELAKTGFKPTDKTALYLPRHAAESFENWQSRINQSYYDDLFAKAIRQFVGLIFKNDVNFTSDFDGSEFISHYENLDNHGVNGDVFFRQVALMAMRLGHCFIFIDLPVINAKNYQEYSELSPRPYWSLISPQNLINWECEFIDNKLVFTLAVIKEEIYVRVGEFGYQKINQYRVYRPGSYFIYREVDNKAENKTDNKTDNKFVLYSSGDFISEYAYVPIVPVFGGSRLDDCVSVPPLRGLADKNRVLYQLTSDHNRKVSLCCQPVPVLKDSMRGDEPLEIGPNSFINLRDPNGSFQWVEPLAMSLEQSRKDLNDLRASISNDAANFLTSPSDRQTSSATYLLASPVEASLASFTANFSDGINQAIVIHNQMINCDCEVKIVLDTKLLAASDAPKKEQVAIALRGLFTDGVIGRETTLKALDKLKLFDNDFNLEQELKADDRYIKL
jgi:hypothetical protein